MICTLFNPIFLDCQTTGANFANAKLLELGINDSAWVIKQEEAVPKKILKLIGIDHKEVAEGVSSAFVFEQLQEITASQQSPIFVAHFAQFEKRWIDALYVEHKKNRDIEFICIHRLAKLLHPNLPSYGLKALAGYFGQPIAQGKRALDHTRATKEIWDLLCQNLSDRQIETQEHFWQFYHQKQPKKSGRTSFLITKEQRLAIPRGPGIYRFYDRNKRLLYIGKATSLRSRVNSYFTGSCRRDHRKLEMLAQAENFEVTPLATPLHAGVMEFQLIRAHLPPYNIAFAGNPPEPFFDLKLLCTPVKELDQDFLLEASKRFFYGNIEIQTLIDGLELWRAQERIDSQKVLTQRELIKMGWTIAWRWQQKLKLEAAAKLLLAEIKDLLPQNLEAQDGEGNSEGDVEDSESEDVEFVWTADLVAQECNKIMRRATVNHLRLLWMKRLENRELKIESRKSKSQIEHSNLDIGSIDPTDPRMMNVIIHELKRLNVRGTNWQIAGRTSTVIPCWVK